MKKLLILCVPLLLCGCNAEKVFGMSKPDYDTSYNVKADISFGEFETSADITRRENDNWEFTFTEPEYLSGIKLNLNDEGMTASLGALSFNVGEIDFCKLVPDIIADSIDSLKDISVDTITENEGVLTLTTESDDKNVIVITDKSGSLISLKCPFYKVSVDFSNQTAINDAPTPSIDDEGGVELIE